jgi:glycerol-3-phosphate O-acyltransferase / dihydroxyacetone phosphate acyltransferase
MWLHQHLHRLISFAGRFYYDIRVVGEPVPRAGAVLLVANHPNSLMDPALVAAAADRPVRFLAKAPLFRERSIGWLIRGSGAIPVYRRDDDPRQMGKNQEMFSAAWEALAQGSAVGIFPEGLSHSEPSLAPLKTGAARIALGAGRLAGKAFPILPVGITFRGGKERFRSQALILVGKPIHWADLIPGPATPGEADPAEAPDRVRALTSRVEAGLSRVTVNLKSWDDFPLVEGAEAIHNAELGRSRSGNPVRWLARMRRTARTLESARETKRSDAEPLARDIVRHMRVLNVLGLRPRDLHQVPPASVAIRWTLGNLFFFGIALPLAVMGTIAFYPPYWLVGWAEPRWNLPDDRRATYKLLGGTVAFGGWILLISAGLRELMGWRPAVWALVLLPLLGILTIRIRDRWDDAVSDLRRFLVLRGRSDLRSRLIERQRELAERLRALQQELERPQ